MKKLLTLLSLSLFLVACSSVNQDEPGLYFEGDSPILKVGEYTDLVFKKVSVTGVTGKIKVDENYTDVKFSYKKKSDSLFVEISGNSLKGLLKTDSSVTLLVGDKSAQYFTDIKLTVKN